MLLGSCLDDNSRTVYDENYPLRHDNAFKGSKVRRHRLVREILIICLRSRKMGVPFEALIPYGIIVVVCRKQYRLLYQAFP